MAYIGKQPIIGNFQICDAISTVNGQAAYTLQVGGANVSPETVNNMIVSVNGVIQKPTASYTVSGSTITFTSNLVTGDVIDFIQILGNVLDLGTPSDATVTTAKIADGAVTSAKLASGTGGKVLQVLQAVKTDTFTYASNTYGDLTGITLAITPSATSSKILVMTQLSMAVDVGGQPSLKLLRDSTALNLGAAASNRIQATTTYFTEATWEMTPVSIVYLDSPSSTSALTYKVQGRTAGSGNTLYLNRSGADSDSDSYSRAGSSIVLMEIAG